MENFDFQAGREEQESGFASGRLSESVFVPGSKWSVLPSQEAMTNISQLYPEKVSIRVYVDDVKLHLRGQSEESESRSTDVVSIVKE